MALLAATGCHKKAVVAADPGPVFSDTVLAQGSTGDNMSHLAEKYGIPLYPGAMPDSSHFNAAAGNNSRVYLAYTTPDTTDKVVNFYKSNLNMGSNTAGAVTVLSGSAHDGSPVTINVGQKMDGSGTSFSIIITVLDNQPVADLSATANSASTYATPAATIPQAPPNAAPKDMSTQDNTTYYVPTASSPDDSSGEIAGEGSGEGDSGDGTQSNDQSSTGDQQPEDGSSPPGG